MKVAHTAGSWDPNHWPMYFIAADMDTLRISSECNENILVAVNELRGERDILSVHDFVGMKKRVLIDSGVYNLSTQHAERHGLTMNQALSLSPAEVDGFDELFDLYIALLRQFGDKVWGYIEIDQGGRENKIKTRAKLEKMGFAPIPVYHPMNDGWEYFDYLAQRYDRICFGNVVMADSVARKRLIATAWERRRKYPKLWIHALGMTPSATTTAFPVNSCDSSTWISSVRWGSHKALIANDSASELGIEFLYDQSVDPEHERGHRKARCMCAYDAMMMSRTMQNIMNDQREAVGADPLFATGSKR